MRPPVVALVGPTASGKTELAIALARRLGGEVVSADSRQLYRGFDAGTAKPQFGPDGLAVDGAGPGAPYHLVDTADPSETVSAGAYARLAGPILKAIADRGRPAIVAGGTGLYIRALLEGFDELPEADPAVRSELSAEADRLGLPALHQRLAEADPDAAVRIPPGNRQRLIRALEVQRITGRPISSFWGKKDGTAGPKPLYLSIRWEPDQLRGRIERRSKAMWPGILTEVRRLLERWPRTSPAFQSIGYREALDCVEGRTTPEQGLLLMTRATLAYAKRQRTWFSGQVPDAVRIPGGPIDAMLAAVLAAIERKEEPA
ncbi:MAG: tRNA (adenosine(37)-N6)-dimethylallyltransferase MiaA [Elusimicrobiota bacterium]|jgi:tRNA dimethylallyltransferase